MGAEPDRDDDCALLVGRYEVGPLVGIGGTAEVHRAWDRERGRRVAVKIFRPGSAPTPGYGGARELQVLDGVSHPGVVGVHDSGVDAAGRPFVVMDFVDGLSLAERRGDGPLPPADVVRIGAVLADALAVVHARGVVHRDVKPANVLLDTDGHPWLTDFGIARIIDATRVTATGVVVGTAAYMAPEQVRGEPVGSPADVYALGLVMLEAATGRREYEGNAIESALARLHRAPRVPAGVPEPLAAAVRAMTARLPGDRPTATEVAAALRGSDPARPDPARPDPARPGPARLGARGRWVVPVAAVAALVAAASAGALTLTGSGSGEGPASAVRAPAVRAAAAPETALLAPARPLPVPDLAGAIQVVDGVVAAAPPVPVALTSPDPVPGAALPAAGPTGDDDGPRAARPADEGGDRNDADDTHRHDSGDGTDGDDRDDGADGVDRGSATRSGDDDGGEKKGSDRKSSHSRGGDEKGGDEKSSHGKDDDGGSRKGGTGGHSGSDSGKR